MTRTIFTALMAIAACDLPITSPDLPGWEPVPFPAVPGAWEPCSEGEADPCSGQGLSCLVPGESWGGVCTWACIADADCMPLLVDQQAVPRCYEGSCQLRCWEFDEECPEGMTCEEAEGEAKICAWTGALEN